MCPLPPVETSGDKESNAYKDSADASSRRTGAAAGEIIEVCLVLVHDDQYPEHAEAEKQANQA